MKQEPTGVVCSAAGRILVVYGREGAKCADAAGRVGMSVAWVMTGCGETVRNVVRVEEGARKSDAREAAGALFRRSTANAGNQAGPRCDQVIVGIVQPPAHSQVLC